MKVALVPCGPTEWNGQRRLLGRVELGLAEEGALLCAAWAQRLASLAPERILHSPDALATQTAKLIARRLSVPTKALKGLAEVDLGLWAGLTEAQLKTRFATAHHELREAPLSVSPPSGESLAAAARRLETCVHKLLKRNNAAAVGLVLRPFALALLHAVLEQRDVGDLWDALRRVEEPLVIDTAGPIAEAQASG